MEKSVKNTIDLTDAILDVIDSEECSAFQVLSSLELALGLYISSMALLAKDKDVRKMAMEEILNDAVSNLERVVRDTVEIEGDSNAS